MNDNDLDSSEKMAIWIAFTVKEFTSDEIETLSIALQTKLNELKEITNG